MELSSIRKSARTYVMVVWAMMLLSTSGSAFAQSNETISVTGTSQAGQLGAVNNFSATIIDFALNTVAKVIGVAVAVWAVTDFVKRDIMWGCVKLFACGACFFLQDLIAALARMGGGTA